MLLQKQLMLLFVVGLFSCSTKEPETKSIETTQNTEMNSVADEENIDEAPLKLDQYSSNSSNYSKYCNDRFDYCIKYIYKLPCFQ